MNIFKTIARIIICVSVTVVYAFCLYSFAMWLASF